MVKIKVSKEFKQQQELLREEFMRYSAEEDARLKEALDHYEAGQATPEDMELIKEAEAVFYCP